MIRIITPAGFDYVKLSLLSFYIRSGYAVCLA